MVPLYKLARVHCITCKYRITQCTKDMELTCRKSLTLKKLHHTRPTNYVPFMSCN